MKSPIPPVSEPPIDTRFIYPISRFDKKTRKYETVLALNADGHIDYAYTCGFDSISTEIVNEQIIEGADGSTTHWVTVKATVSVKGRQFNGLACCNSRVVSTAGFEVAIAETRAIKRAIAIAYNITEKKINPGGIKPTREIVDIPLDHHEHELNDDEIPDSIRKSPEDMVSGSDEQFEV